MKRSLLDQLEIQSGDGDHSILVVYGKNTFVCRLTKYMHRFVIPMKLVGKLRLNKQLRILELK